MEFVSVCKTETGGRKRAVKNHAAHGNLTSKYVVAYVLIRDRAIEKKIKFITDFQKFVSLVTDYQKFVSFVTDFQKFISFVKVVSPINPPPR